MAPPRTGETLSSSHRASSGAEEVPLVRTEGFVLRVQSLGEADKIVTFFTREEGRLRAVARSARRSRRRFGSSLELWSRVALVLFEKEDRELARIDGCDLLESAYRLQEDLETAFALAYLAEVTEMFTRERQPEPHYYRLVTSILAGLRSGLSRPVALRYFEVWTLRLHGLLPGLEACGECGRRLGRSGATFQRRTSQVLCRTCLPRPAPGDVPLGAAARDLVERAQRTPPRDLIPGTPPRGPLSEVGRFCAVALSEFAETPFRTARFVAVAEEPSR
jgi:DNA repair protein RecO (recombination protein O)